MAQYKTGTVAVVSGSTTVTGTGTAWLANVPVDVPGTVNPAFRIRGGGVSYVVAAVVSNTELNLTTPYAGATASDLAYEIDKDFSPILGLHEFSDKDHDWPQKLTENMRKIDQAIPPQRITNGAVFPVSPASGDIHVFPLTVTEFGGNPVMRPLLDGSLDGLSLRDCTFVQEGDGTYSLFYGGYSSPTQLSPPENQEYLFSATSSHPDGGFVREGLMDLSGGNYADYYSRHSSNSPSFVFDGVDTWHWFGNGRIVSDANIKVISHYKATGTASRVPRTGWTAYAPAFSPQGAGWTSIGSPPQVYLPQVHPKDGGGWIMFMAHHNFGGGDWSVGYATSPDLETWTDGGKLIGQSGVYDCEYPQYFKGGGKHYLLVHNTDTSIQGIDLWVSDAQTGPYVLAMEDIVKRGGWKGLVGDISLAGDDLAADGYLYGIFDANYTATGFGSNSLGSIKISLAPAVYKYNGTQWVTSPATGNGITLPNGLVSLNDDRVGFGVTLPKAQYHLSKDWPSVSTSHIAFALDGYKDQSRISMRRANGTQAAPTATLSGDALGNFGFRGHDGTNFSSSSIAALTAAATENFTPTAQGSRVLIFTTPNGSTTSTERVRVNQDGAVMIGQTTNANDSKLVVNGVIESASGGIRFPDGTVQTSKGALINYDETTGMLTLPKLVNAGQYRLWVTSDAGFNVASINYDGSAIFASVNTGTVDASTYKVGGVPVTFGSGTVTSITPGTGFTSATPITTSGTLNVNIGTGASQVAAQDASGNLGIGITATDRLHVYKNNSSGNVTSIFEGVLPAANGPYITFKKATYSGGSPVAIGSGDVIGGVLLQGATGAGTYDSVRSPLQFLAAEAWTTATGGWDAVIKTRPTGQGSLGAPSDRLRLTANGNVVLGAQAALSTNATDGFIYIPTCAGAPTGTPTAYTGKVAMLYDSTNNKLYAYNGAWKGVTLA